MAAPVAKISVNLPVAVALLDRVRVPVPAPLDTVVPEGKRPEFEYGPVTVWPLAMVAGKVEPLLESMVTVDEPEVVSTLTSRLGPRFSSWPQSLMVPRHHSRVATLVSSAPVLVMLVSLVPLNDEPDGLSPGSQPAATGPTTPPLMVL